MKKFLIISFLTGTFGGLAALANATSFSFSVDVENKSGNLVVAETRLIAFPTIVVDGSTKAGASCFTDAAPNELCRLSTPSFSGRRGGAYSVTGSVLAPVTLILSAPTTVNGLEFTPSFDKTGVASGAGHTLSNSGVATDEVYGQLKLIDPALVTSQVTVFVFDITAAYN